MTYLTLSENASIIPIKRGYIKGIWRDSSYNMQLYDPLQYLSIFCLWIKLVVIIDRWYCAHSFSLVEP